MAKLLSSWAWTRIAVVFSCYVAACGPAHAQALPGAQDWAKTEAILGGTPSALQAILSQQSGVQSDTRTVRPASFATASFPHATREASVSPAVISGRPDLFGSIALRVGHTTLDSRWRSVEEARVTGPAARFARSLASLDELKRLQAVNRYVNHRVRYVEDQQQYGRPDVWSAATETLRRGRGDCEDFAIAKLQMLRDANFSDRDIYLAIVKDLVRRADHAVVVVRASGHMFLLDDGTDTVLDSDAVSDYRPMFTFAANGEWTHGYRIAPEISVAAADTRDTPPLVLAAADQRSWSASLLALSTGFSK